MDDVPQYMTFVVRGDGEEFGVFAHGASKKFLSVFPSDLFQYQIFHDSMDQAINHLSDIWKKINNLTEHTAFLCEVVKQRSHHAMLVDCIGNC